MIERESLHPSLQPSRGAWAASKKGRIMKRVGTFLLGLLVLFLLLQCKCGQKDAGDAGSADPSLAAMTEKGPKIRFDEKDFDFGVAEEGENVEHVFTFRNVGDKPLSIHKVRTSCGCTGALISSEEVQPGEKGEIKATFRTKGFQGSVKKSLTVESNDPENNLVRITLKGKVSSEVTVEPRYLNWRTVNPGEPPEPLKLTIKLRDGKDLRIHEVRSESESVILKKEKENQEEAVYSVMLSENPPTGRLTGRIAVRTNSEQRPRIHVPFYAQIEGNVTVSPPLLSLGVVRPGKPVRKSVTVKKTGGEELAVDRIKVTAEEMKTEIVTEKQGERFRIDVVYDPGSRTSGDIAERLTIFVRNGKEEILEVPVYGVVKEIEKEQPTS